MHCVVVHGKKSDVNSHIDTTFCTVCELEMHSRPAVLEHLYKSVICRANILLKPKILTDAERDAFDSECAVIRQKNKKCLMPKHHSDLPCVRHLGPYRPVYNLAGELIVTSNGHPLSSNHPWHRPPQLADRDECSSILGGCHASLRKPCTVLCCLCHGQSGVS